MTKQKKTFEEALAELEQIVCQIEEGKVSLDESIEKYSEGTKLIEICRSILNRAEKKISVLSGDTDNIQEMDLSEDE